jgi:uncharacterized protein YjbJ (UPF0337 family)
MELEKAGTSPRETTVKCFSPVTERMVGLRDHQEAFSPHFWQFDQPTLLIKTRNGAGRSQQFHGPVRNEKLGAGYLHSSLTSECTMSGTSDKAAGVTNEVIGKAKQGIGGAVGSDKMKSEGAAQEAKGDAQKAVGDAKNATKEAVDKTADALKKPL